MKKFLCLILMAIMLSAVPALSTQWLHDKIATVKASTDKTADALIRTGACVFYGIVFEADGTNDVDFTVYNGLNTTGTSISPANLTVPGTSKAYTFSADPPVYCSTGIYVDITTTGTVNYKVYYDY